MKLMTCPINGSRPISEFAYGGELREMPDPAAATDEEWAAYVFNRNGAPGIKQEWWCHTPSGVWFIAVRDTATDAVLRTHLFGHDMDQVVDNDVSQHVGPPAADPGADEGLT